MIFIFHFITYIVVTCLLALNEYLKKFHCTDGKNTQLPVRLLKTFKVIGGHPNLKPKLVTQNSSDKTIFRLSMTFNYVNVCI